MSTHRVRWEPPGTVTYLACLNFSLMCHRSWNHVGTFTGILLSAGQEGACNRKNGEHIFAIPPESRVTMWVNRTNPPELALGILGDGTLAPKLLQTTIRGQVVALDDASFIEIDHSFP